MSKLASVRLCGCTGTVMTKQLKYVAQGLLSDSPHIPLYLRLRKMLSGFQLYRCLRTSSALEGYHVHCQCSIP